MQKKKKKTLSILMSYNVKNKTIAGRNVYLSHSYSEQHVTMGGAFYIPSQRQAKSDQG